MKTIRIISALLIITQIAFAQENKKAIAPKAYAEISVKQDGKWEGQKYIGGNFKNVSSMKLAKEHTDHSFDIRYEGPGFENKHIAYRLYLDWRNAIDLFGKYSDTIVLPKIGLDGFDSYHEKCEWGSDILKVGKGMGIGSIGRLLNNQVLHFNAVDSTFVKIENLSKQSNVLVNYFGWNTANEKIDLKSKLSVFPDEYYVKHTIIPSKSTSGICTGIVKLKNLELIKAESANKKWAYIATYGPQTMFSDNLGMAILYQTATVDSLVKGVDDHLIVFKPSNTAVTFYFLGAWEKEKAGLKSQEEFISYLNKQLVLLNNSNSLPVVENEKAIVINDSMKWSKRMALSIMKRHPEAYQIDEQKSPKWDYVHGLVLTSLEKLYKKTGDKQYYSYIKNYADALIDEKGKIKTYKFEDYNIDMITAGRILFNLYSKTKEVKYLEAMKLLRKQISEQPRTSEGGFWHKKRYPNQMWLDGLYMGEPFYAQYTSTFENGKQLNDVAKQFELIQKHATDPKTGLLYHAWDESKLMAWANKEDGKSPNFWSRSIGWYAMALVDALDYFPKNHPKRKELMGYLNSLAVALDKAKDEKYGLWYQVTDQGNREGNYLESSGSSMFIYALAKGVNKGYLPVKYKVIASNSFNSLTSLLIKKGEDGEITITQACAVAGLGGNPYRDGSYSYYVNERKKDNDPKATGSFILAALELDK